MYLKYFGFVTDPFSKWAPHDELYWNLVKYNVLGQLIFVVKHNLCAVLTGEFWVGKSTLLRYLKNSLDKSVYDFFYLAEPKLTPRHLYNSLLLQMGKPRANSCGDARRMAHQEIENIRRLSHRRVVIIVDEAHLLDREMLEELRFPLNFKMDSRNHLALILSGHTELEDNLDKKTASATRQRVDLNCRLFPLSLDDTWEYIKHRMYSYGGLERAIMSQGVVERIYGYSSGLPRLINKVCASSLMYAYYCGKDIIDEDLVNKVINNDLQDIMVRYPNNF
jgi:type II secretory pathway predicted ATPase ExeA